MFVSLRGRQHVGTVASLVICLAVSSVLGVELYKKKTPASSQYNYKCGEALSDKIALPEDNHEDPYQLFIEMGSPTTFTVSFFDQYLQLTRPFHPVKCSNYEGAENNPSWEGMCGRLLLLQNSCWLRNTDDIASCFRKEYFPYPVPPGSTTVKHEIPVRADRKGFRVWNGTKVQLSQRPVHASLQKLRDSKKMVASDGTDYGGTFDVEVCAHVGDCVGNSGLCQPAFYLIAEDWSYKPNVNAWAGSDFHAGLDFSTVAYDWSQVHATPQHGPYPHCPSDSNGRAKQCTGEEQLTLSIPKLELKSAKLGAGFEISYTLEWGDRYAVHPCTINLWRVRTNGKPLRVPSSQFWTPQLSAANAAKDHKVMFKSGSHGVNHDFGRPVNESVPDDSIWPVQLILSTEHEVTFYPEVETDMSKYPFDSQSMKLVLSELSVDPGAFNFIMRDGAWKPNNADIEVGPAWTLRSTAAKLETWRGRPVVSITVTVDRNPKTLIFKLFLPMITFCVIDSMGHAIFPYDMGPQLFMSSALMIGVAVKMMDPAFLGIPPSMDGMPFIQCAALMLVLGCLKTCVLIMGRFFWTYRINRLENPSESNVSVQKKDMVVPMSETLETREEDGELAKLELAKLKVQLKIYDRVIKGLVPLWYFVSLLATAGSYDVM